MLLTKLLRRPIRPALCLIAVLCHVDAQAGGSESAARPWTYRIGETGAPRQGNFCDDRAAALEIAQIFVRFGAPTGFSALANAPACATRVHTVTPESLLREVTIKLANGTSYMVNFIQVQADDGTRPVLITTRELITD